MKNTDGLLEIGFAVAVVFSINSVLLMHHVQKFGITLGSAKFVE